MTPTRFTPKYTCADVSRIIDRDPSTIRRHALMYHIGTLVTPRMRMFSESDLDRLKAIAASGAGRKPGPQNPDRTKKE